MTDVYLRVCMGPISPHVIQLPHLMELRMHKHCHYQAEM